MPTTSDTNSANNSSQSTIHVIACPGTAPTLVTPASGATTTSPVNLSWSSVAGATSYIVTITGASSSTLPATTATATNVILSPGSYSWTVQATFSGGCPSLTSAAGTFTVCNIPDAPLASAVGETTTGQTYSVEWTAVGDSTTYELQEAADPSFTNPTVFTVNGTSQNFTKSATTATPFFYRVHAISTCAAAPFSPVISVT